MRKGCRLQQWLQVLADPVVWQGAVDQADKLSKGAPLIFDIVPFSSRQLSRMFESGSLAHRSSAFS